MSLHTASPHRVARSWLLTKLLGPEQPKGTGPRARGHALSDREREKVLESAYKTLKSDLIRVMKSQFPAIDQAEKRIAKKHGIDALFLNWYLVNGTNWPSMPARVKKGLRALQSMRIWFGEVPNTWSRMVVPTMDEARARDAALRELGEQFLRAVVPKVETKFTNHIWTKSRELLDLFQGRGKGSKQQASILLLKDFKNRLGADGFQLKPAVRRMMELFD